MKATKRLFQNSLNIYKLQFRKFTIITTKIPKLGDSISSATIQTLFKRNFFIIIISFLIKIRIKKSFKFIKIKYRGWRFCRNRRGGSNIRNRKNYS